VHCRETKKRKRFALVTRVLFFFKYNFRRQLSQCRRCFYDYRWYNINNNNNSCIESTYRETRRRRAHRHRRNIGRVLKRRLCVCLPRAYFFFPFRPRARGTHTDDENCRPPPWQPSRRRHHPTDRARATVSPDVPVTCVRA